MNRLLSAVIMLVAFAACFDKVVDDEVEAQGGETPGIGPGARHRAGQNCTACHGPLGGEGPEISVGGTVYKRKDSDDPAVKAKVFITDFKNETRSFETNDVGNFHEVKDTWDPVFPLKIVVEYAEDGIACREEMFSLSRRDGGCGKCHDKRSNGDREHMPRVYAIKEGCEAPKGGP
jgi:cytochrome c553